MIKQYEKNISYLLSLPKKKRYDKLTKYAIGSIDGKDIYLTEFLVAKQFGYIDKFTGHDELKGYMKLIPYIFTYNYFDELFQNLDNNRFIYSVFDEDKRRLFHIIDENNFLVSLYVTSQNRYERQIDKKYRFVKNLNGGAALSLILCPAGPFWRHSDLIEKLYQNLKKMSNDKKYKHLNTIGRYWRKKYHEKVYKIPISISGFTCPNIDGTVAKGGCSFCENESFSPNLEDRSKFKLNLKSKENPYLTKQLKQLEQQFTTTKEILQNKFGAKRFIVYFQSFTNTYAPLDTLKALYSQALDFDDVVGLSIGTRADSITDETLEFLQKLNQTKEVWVEYGIQSVYDKTLDKVNRAESFDTIKNTILKTKKLGLNVCGHLIFGLPDETQEMMLESVKQSVALGIDSIKFHPLYVVKNTLLTNEYKKGKFTPISEELYIDTLVKAIKILPQDVSIARVTAGISDSSLLAPKWCDNKHNQIHKIKKALVKEGLIY